MPDSQRGKFGAGSRDGVQGWSRAEEITKPQRSTAALFTDGRMRGDV